MTEELDRGRLVEAMDVVLDILRVGQVLARIGTEAASLEHVVNSLERLARGLVAEGHVAVARELQQQLLRLAPD